MIAKSESKHYCEMFYQSGEVNAGDSSEQPGRLVEIYQIQSNLKNTRLIKTSNKLSQAKPNQPVLTKVWLQKEPTMISLKGINTIITSHFFHRGLSTIAAVVCKHLPLLLNSPPSSKALNSPLHSWQVHSNL